MKTERLSANDINRAAEILKANGLVAIPTETVYGLAAKACSGEAVAKVFEAKKRPFFDPLIVHVCEVEDIRALTSSIPEKAERLIEAFWPGPLTIILPKSDIVPDLVTSGLPTVALRSPSHPVAREIIKATGEPIAAPSANLFTHTSPTSSDIVLEMLDGRIEGIIEGGECDLGIESTVISFAEEEPTLFRPGGVTVEMIEAVIGPIKTAPKTGEVSASPGRLEKHYAPRCRMVLNSSPADFPEIEQRAALLFGNMDENRELFKSVENLSPKGDLREAAHNLYAAIRRLDKEGVEIIFATSVPHTGLGVAINDRLCRASENGLKVEL